MPRPASPAVPPKAVSASEFKATCLDLMDEVARTRGELIVTKHGRPVVRVSPIEDTAPSPVGFLAGSVVRHGDIVSPDLRGWEPSPTDPLVGAPASRRRR